MEAKKDKNEVYEVKFEQLVEGEKTSISAMDQIMNANLYVTVSMGSTHERLGKIANLSIGDVIVLDKHVEEALDINVNGRTIASGESIILDSKLAVRLSNIKSVEDAH